MTPLEKVARALFEHTSIGHIANGTSWDDCGSKGMWLASARVALAALREPSEFMVKEAYWNALAEDARLVWIDMIDAALSEGAALGEEG